MATPSPSLWGHVHPMAVPGCQPLDFELSRHQHVVLTSPGSPCSAPKMMFQRCLMENLMILSSFFLPSVCCNEGVSSIPLSAKPIFSAQL